MAEPASPLPALDSVPETLDVAPLVAQLREDPYPLYRMLREGGRAHYSERPRGWLIPRYDDVSAVLRDPRLCVDGERRQANQKLYSSSLREHRRHTLFYMDPPDHTRLRDRVRHAFTPRRAARMRERIQSIADELIDAVLPSGRMELIADFAYPLPVRVIAELLGVPAEDLALLRRWSDDLAVLLVEPFKGEGFEAKAEASLAEMRTYFANIFAMRRSAPRGDLVSGLVAEDALDERELFGLVSLMLVAGHETTSNLIGNSVLALLRDPDAHAFLMRNPERIPGAIDELLRFESPVQVAQRIAREDCVVAGQPVEAGQCLFAMLGSANRDPDAFPNPDRLDFERGDVRHLAFGQGVHFCLGASLARLEGAVALETLLRRLPGLESDGEAPVWRERIVLRGLERLPVHF